MSDAVSSGDIKLTDATASKLVKAMNAIGDHMTDMDVKGAVQDAAGLKSGGQHLKEVTDAAKSLSNLASSLSGALKDPNLAAKTRQLFTNTLGALNSATQAVTNLTANNQNPQ